MRRAFTPGRWLSHFELHGQEFGHRTAMAYLQGARRLTAGGPGVLTHARLRGDTLFYDPAANEFAAVAADGYTILTYFRPRTGMAYWQRVTRGRRREQDH